MVQEDRVEFAALLQRAWDRDAKLGPALLRQAEHLAALRWPEQFFAHVMKYDVKAIVGSTLARG